MTIEEMRQRRRELGYNYAMLSELSGVPIPTLQKVFSGTTANPRFETIQALERVLGRDVSSDPAAVTGMVRESAVDYTVKFPYDRQGTYTIEDRETIPDEHRTELIDGVIYDMASPGSFHQQAAGEVYYQIMTFVKAHGGDCMPMMAPMDVQLDCDERTIVQPDVFVICNTEQITQKMICGAPDFVLEVLSPSTRSRDLILKLNKYLDAGVREYWIIDPYKKQILVYFFESKDGYPVVYPIDAKIPVNIYGGELEIDLSDTLRWLPGVEEEV